ncbi:MAG: hypothetical protein R6U30_11720 [Halomonas sp.]|uniref:EF-hand domain-containing protein n=1 Tax=Halomonas sp. TaxID=1486246 RepID=UPI0039706618
MTNPKTVIFFVVFAFSMGLAGTAVAQSMERFPRLDTNSDGAVTRAEVDGIRDAVFSRLDRNGDGMISTDELQAAQDMIALRAEMRQLRLAKAAAWRDVDGDGSISRAEMDFGPDLFGIVDIDGDDRLDAEELRRVRTLLIGEGKGHRNGR